MFTARWILPLIFVLVLTSTVTGCPPRREVTVTPGVLALEVGQSEQIHATSTDSRNTAFFWDSDNAAVATVYGTIDP